MPPTKPAKTSPILRYLLCGVLAGAANGLFGAGGGMFLVPLFTGWLKMEERKAFATSVAVILPLSVAALWLYWQKGQVDIVGALPYLIGGVIGGWCSRKLFDKVSVVWLRRIFGLLILYGGVRAVLLL